MMSDILLAMISPIVFAGTIRIATPLIIGAVGGCFTNRAGTFIIAYECFMLTSAFFATWGSYMTGSAIGGSLIGIIACIVMGIIFGMLVFHYKADALIISIALNFGAWAITTLLLQSIFGARGAFISEKIISYDQIHLPFLDGLPFITTVFNDKIILVYLSYVIMFIGYIVMYKTTFGLRVRGVGINPTAAETAGVNLLKYKWVTLLIMSVLTGLAGSYIPLSGVSMFTENMTSGRGFLCLAAVLVGQGNPIKAGLIALLFAYTDALFLTLTSFELPTQLLSTMPYFAVIIVLLVNGIKEHKMLARVS
ncbi:MAG TPA: ABC transporter permease [Anaerolineaceae bacterium]|jgi:ABC-type uncharacterized transport system permease subunit|nr:ABC transporter permease [Anaerolineaceae bacterium]